jgi:hypothetical protein
MGKFVVSLLICALLTGCPTIPQKPVTVYVPTYVSCVGERPTKPDAAIPRNDSVSEQVRALLIDMERMRGYVAELEAIVDGCI